MFRRLRKGSSRLAGTPYLYIGRELEKLKGGGLLAEMGLEIIRGSFI